MATGPQKRFIRDLMRERGEKAPPGYLRTLTVGQASDLISRLRGQPTRAERHTHCMACGQELTDAESIERGYGPVCAERYA